MGHIFNSQEVYKHVKGIAPEDNPLRAVRGMYVGGHYRPPYYIDQGFHISKVTSTKADVVDYTVASVSLEPDHIINILGVDCDNDITIEGLGSVNVSLEPDHIINILGVDCNNNDITIEGLGSVNVSLESDHIINILGVDCDNDDFVINELINKDIQNITNQMVCINDITSIPAIIIDLT